MKKRMVSLHVQAADLHERFSLLRMCLSQRVTQPSNNIVCAKRNKPTLIDLHSGLEEANQQNKKHVENTTKENIIDYLKKFH